jgi:hypothetical protein
MRACGKVPTPPPQNVGDLDPARLTKREWAELSRLLCAAFQLCPVCQKPQPRFEAVPPEDLHRCVALYRKMSGA